MRNQNQSGENMNVKQLDETRMCNRPDEESNTPPEQRVQPLQE